MQRHFAHIARSHTGGQAGEQGGSSLPVTARKPMGWVGSAASPPFRTTRGSLYPEPAAGLGLPLPAVPQPPALGKIRHSPLRLVPPILLRCSH